ncbi:aminotransferase class V-fold PLP-dependent enzyme [Qingshengfaniella alkalisoli]|uniref:Aminotransferase class V-fold PLP-dependent enzyme n=1 Tax=Qingshengfaniella alkalisoli TaxID=2599296 RepID=A0A5B8IX83_9RHOB|nr:aminotransferase class V-fold PLP-dependent enzyme [Qingshengfaniella alkalisoli]QDY70772.1 aminotransferase class V-fold PLP-dependent enzyme [Qingshengfaniella alkalisoli]
MSNQHLAPIANDRIRPVINVSGTMTGLGASIIVPQAREAMVEIAPHFIDMHSLQAEASKVIARLTGAEAGCATASAAAGISLSVAACITGQNPARVEALPDTGDQPNEVAVQAGHLCHYGASIEQAIRLTGGKPVVVGQSTQALDHQLDGALGPRTAAALYVVSHHVVDYGQIPLRAFAEICHARGVPVIVDAASEYDLTGFLDQGADIVIYSGHKFLGGPTSGLICGKRDLVKAAYMQNLGIGRGMKIGKESIYGTIAALEAWEQRDHDGIRQRERRALDLWYETLSGRQGVIPRISPDPTGNPLDRLRVDIDAAATGASAAAVVAALASGSPKIVARDHEIEQGWFQLDPCNLHEGDEDIVARRLMEVLDAARNGALVEPDLDLKRNGSVNAYMNWAG